MKDEYVEHLEYSTVKTNDPIRKRVKDMKRHFSREYTHDKWAHEKVFYVISRYTVRYYCILSDWLKIKKKK